MRAIIKPIRDNVSNIAIFNYNWDFLNKIESAGWKVSKYAYESRKYKDAIPELYNYDHIEIPYPMLYKLNKNGRSDDLFSKSLVQQIEWSPDAWSLYLSSLDRHEIVVQIKKMNMEFIRDYLNQNGISPEICHVNNKPFRDHQLQSLALYIATEGHCANFGQMRTGKTPPTILYSYYAIIRKQVDCVLCVVPNHIKWLWKEEIPKVLPEWINSLTCVVEGTKAAKFDLWNSYQLFYIVNYESLRADIDIVQEAFRDKKYLLVLDECHAVKNADTKQTQAVLSLEPAQTILMSGSPVANKPQDIFIPSQIIAPHLLGYSQAHFKSEWAWTDTYGNVKDFKKNWFRKDDGKYVGALDEIHNRLAVVSCRVLRKDVNLEAGKVIQPQIIEMPDKLQKLYEQATDQFLLELNSASDRTKLFITSFLARLIRLQQLTGGYLPKLGKDGAIEKYLWLDSEFGIPNAKIKFIDDWIDEYLDDVGKLVIFSRFVPILERLNSRYSKFGSRLIYGGTDKHDVARFINEFKTNDDVRIMLCNTVCAEGKDFNPCNFVFFYDRVWGLKDNTQAEDRVTGMLQTKESTIMPLALKGTIDEKLEFTVLPKKRSDAAKIEDGTGVSESYTVQDLYDLLS